MKWNAKHWISAVVGCSAVFTFFMKSDGIGGTLTNAGIFFGLVTFTAGLLLKSVSDVGVAVMSINRQQREEILNSLSEYRQRLIKRVCVILVMVTVMILGGNYIKDNRDMLNGSVPNVEKVVVAVLSSGILVFTISRIIGMFSEYDQSETDRTNLAKQIADAQRRSEDHDGAGLSGKN